MKCLYSASTLLLSMVMMPFTAHAVGTTALKATDFLNSIGTQSAISVRGENFQQTVNCIKYLGVRWMRGGVEGDVPIQQYIDLHNQAGVRFSWGLGSGGSDVAKLIETGKQVAAGNALLAFEGPNEPNNWGITYQGQAGGKDQSWVPVANLMRDLYKAIKSDPVLKAYPVFSTTEGGAEKDNVGLQFLTVPQGAKIAMPDGTQYADYANVHNYIYHPNSPDPADNKTWNAADPGAASKVDGLYGEYGLTWAHHYPGYNDTDLLTLPRVTTETGTTIGGSVSEDYHALNLLSMYLDQFKRGWSYTNVYLMRDRVDEGGNQQFGFFKPDYTPRKAAVYLHNLTTILADSGTLTKPGQLNYTIPNEPATVHHMLLQKSDGTLELLVWSELVHGANTITVHLGGLHKGMKVYDPTIGTAPIQLPFNQIPGTSESLNLVLSEHPLIIEIPAKAN